MKRLVSAPVFRLKGGGWYETDFKSDQEGKRNLAAGEEAAEAKSEDKESAADKPPTTRQRSRQSRSQGSRNEARGRRRNPQSDG